MRYAFRLFALQFQSLCFNKPLDEINTSSLELNFWQIFVHFRFSQLQDTIATFTLIIFSRIVATNLLPPAKEVCGKVMFLHVSVILSTGGYVWQGGMHGRGCAWQGGMCGGGHAWWGACVAVVCMAGEMATAVGSTHPTGMHSCSF